MKLIKITTENQISVHDFPEGSFMERNQALRDHIGPKCELYEMLCRSVCIKSFMAPVKEETV